MAIPKITIPPAQNVDYFGSFNNSAGRGDNISFSDSDSDSLYKSDVQSLREIYNKHASVSRSTRFEVDFSALNTLNLKKRNDQSFSKEDFYDMGYFVKNITMPNRRLKTVSYDLFRQEVDLPTGYNNDDLTINFNIPGDYFIKDIFDAWLRLIIPPESYLMQYEDTYKINLEINVLDDRDQIKYKIYLTDVFPKSVPSIELAAETTAINSLNVTFGYTRLIFDEAKR